MDVILPDGRKETLNCVDNFDFNWHIMYEYREDVAPLLATAKYSLLIAEYSDIETLKKNFDGAPEKPGILPIVIASDRSVEAQVKRDFHCLLKPAKMSDNDALAEIDHALDIRLKDGGRQSR